MTRPPGDDFTTWDLPRIFAEIDKQFSKALAAEKVLKDIPIATYDALLEKGNVPDLQAGLQDLASKIDQQAALG